MSEANIGIVRRYIAAIEAFDVAAVSELLDPEIVQTEHPDLLYPKGQMRGLTLMTTDLPRGKTLLRSQAYPIATIFGAGDKVAVETRWEGILSVPLGTLNPGDAMVAHICMIFTLRDGRIVGQTNYDCYEDFRSRDEERQPPDSMRFTS